MRKKGLFSIVFALVSLVSTVLWANSAVQLTNVTTNQQSCGSEVVGVCYTLSNADGDITGDGKVNLDDFAAMAEKWLSSGCTNTNSWCGGADINHSGNVGMEDLIMMTIQWLSNGPDGLIFANIPSGTFQMGDILNEGEKDEKPVHTVTLSSFQMSKYAVTNSQYCQYLNVALAAGQIIVYNNRVYASNDTSHSQVYFETHTADSDSQIDYNSGTFTVRSKSGRDMSNDPVVEVSWYGAKAFCDYYGYRLPTEAEWEYAARGGLSGKRFPWGNTINHSYANYKANGSAFSYDTSSYTSYTFHPTWNDGIYPYTSPVGSFSPNGYGLYDMAGNIWEWCSDWYGSYPSDLQINPTGPTVGSYHVVRNGGWRDKAYYCRVADRYYVSPSITGYIIGFRVCR